MYFSALIRHSLCFTLFIKRSKSIKKLLKIAVWGLVIILSIIIFAWLIVQNSRVQTLLISKATTILEKKLNTKISIRKVDFQPFNKILLKDVLIEDLNKDTLIAAKTLKVSLLWFNTEQNILKLSKVSLSNAYINFNTDSLGVMNFEALLNKISPPDTTKSSSGGKAMGFEIRNIGIENSRFRLKSFNPEKVEQGINFEDIDLRKLNLDARDFGIQGDTISILINDLSFIEKSGFDVEKFRAEFSLCNKHMFFNKLRLKAEGSNLQLPYLHLTYDGIDKMSNFIQDVKLDIQFENSLVKSRTLSYIIPSIANYDFVAVINGKIKGPLSDIRGKNIVITSGTQTRIATNFNISGLPNIDQTMMIIDVKELSTSANDLKEFKLVDTNQPIIELPSELNELKKITYRGNFTGFINNFVAFGTLSTALGKLSLDLSIKPDTTQNTEFSGNVSTINLDIGKLVGTSAIGRISLNAKIKGTSDKKANIKAFTDATISQFEANSYNYSNIKVNGNITNNTYVGSIYLDDPNCKLNFLGKVDFSDSIPVFDFSALVSKIDLAKLKIYTADSISQAAFLFTAKLSGNTLDNSKGEIKLVNSSYKNQNGEFKLSDITINADNNKVSKLITFQSEFAEGELRSKYNYSNIFENLENLFYKYIPVLGANKDTSANSTSNVENPEFNDYIVKFRLKKTRKITDVLAPDFRIAENTSIFAILNPDLNTFTLKIKVPELSVGTNTFKDISIDGQTKDSIFEASINTPYISLGGSIIRNISLSSIAKQNKVDFKFGWDNKQTPINRGVIKALADFKPSKSRKDTTTIINFKPTDFIINDSVWSITPSSITFDSSKIAINQFNIHNQNQSLSITGNISNNPADSIQVNLDNIDISNTNFYLKSMGYEIGGRIDGFAKVKGIYTKPTLFANIGINKFVVNKRPVGNVKFTSEWFNDDKRLYIDLNNQRNDSLTFEAKGNFFTESGKLNLQIDIPEILLQHFSPFLDGIASGFSGVLSGKLKLTGTTSKPLLNGSLNINQGNITIDFMKAPYTINDQISVVNSDLMFKDFKIVDVNKHVAKVNGSVNTGYFGDFHLSLNISPSNFQCINTTEKDNELFYGTVYASGLVAITGTPDDINMNIAVRTENKTMLSLPLSSSSAVAENNFISFINKNSDDIFIEDAAPEKIESSTNMNLTFDLQVTPEAEVQIIIDKKLGDIIKASGSGSLKMNVNPYKDVFKIYGDYIIEKGDYLFTLQGVINKKFRIDQGSSLSWNGDPTDANVNIKAIYKVKTPLKNLLYDFSGKYDNRVPVDCQILLTQKLMSPGIKFKIDVPNTDNETKTLVESALNTEDNINKQFLSLLVINSFLPPSKDIVDRNSTSTNSTQQSNSGLSSGVSNSLSELLSNQLSNWLSQWSKSFDIGFNYRPGSAADKVSSDQVELAISTQLFDDRVSINGNVNTGNRSNTNSIAGDFNVDLKLNKSGKLRLKAFGRSSNDLIQSNSQTFTTGAGIMYREDFNNFNDLMHRVKNTFKQEPINVPLKETQQPIEVKDTTQTQKPENSSLLIIR